jgi:hypothetical protein
MYLTTRIVGLVHTKSAVRGNLFSQKGTVRLKRGSLAVNRPNTNNDAEEAQNMATIYTGRELKEKLAAEGYTFRSYAEMADAIGVEKLDATTNVSGALSTHVRAIKQSRVAQAPKGSKVAKATKAVKSAKKSDATPSASPATSTDSRAPKPGTVNAVLNEYRGQGLKLDLHLVSSWFPDFKGRSRSLAGSHQLSKEQQSRLANTLDVLVGIGELLRGDKAMLAAWDPPNAKDLVGQEIYTYIGICGHQTEISRRMVLDRLSNTNSKVPPFFRLCAECRAIRTAVLNQIPGSAKGDSICSVCQEPTFDTGANGLAKSRADIWENILSGVMSPLNLPLRLRPEHLDSSGKHQALVRNQEQFDRWREEYIANVGLAISAHPELGIELKARMEGEIEAKRLELKLPASK